MIVIVLAVLAVLVVGAVVWARISASRSENRSVETYEHALGVLGEVSKRTESTGFRILPHDETGRPHVGPPIDEGGTQAPSGHAGNQVTPATKPGPLVSPRLPPAGPPKLRFSDPGHPGASGPAPDHTDELGGDPHAGGYDQPPGAAADGRSSSAGLRTPSGLRARPSAARRHREVMARRAATGVAAAIALAAVALAAISLSGGGTHKKAGGTTTTTLRHTGGSPSSTTVTATTAPTSLKPTSVTATDVSFTAPSGHYTLAFQASGGACWVGIEQSTAGPWLFEQTLTDGQSTTYKGSGSLVVRLGAPGYMLLQLNGLPVELPSGVTETYNVDLTAASG